DGARAYVSAEHIGLDRFRLLPTLCWISTSDVFLRALCFGGVACAALLVVGIAPIAVLPALWLLYLSLSVVCRGFLSYQWDALLLEAGLVSVCTAPAVGWERLRERVDPPRLGRWLMLWLLFRLMLGSGAVKLASGDPTWRDLTALTFHYETQPIPTPLAWYANQLPVWFQKMSALAVFGIELIAPWFILGPRRLRALAFALLLGLQALLALTGNYAFFNLLAVALCLFLLDDATFSRAGRSVAPSRDGPSRLGRGATIAFALVTVPVSALMFTGSLGLALPGALLIAPVAESVTPFRSVNSYGLFAVMTTRRDEIIVEGSDDGVSWQAYEFKYKPGEIDRRPPWVAPHQPRLDWQMWFAALDFYGDAPWFRNFCLRLLDGSPDVLRLLARDPFAGRPPAYVRGVRYRYHFTHASSTRGQVSVATAAARGQVSVPTAAETCPQCWWTRDRIGEFSPVLARP
ncbi:MAG: lipase maturation factor family protein, partial [Acidobacteria bacterium]|nr:lipase maturation factor family protein [Acidobacteriota bacterium]